jgi:hypothetical protein
MSDENITAALKDRVEITGDNREVFAATRKIHHELAERAAIDEIAQRPKNFLLHIFIL